MNSLPTDKSIALKFGNFRFLEEGAGTEQEQGWELTAQINIRNQHHNIIFRGEMDTPTHWPIKTPTDCVIPGPPVLCFTPSWGRANHKHFKNYILYEFVCSRPLCLLTARYSDWLGSNVPKQKLVYFTFKNLHEFGHNIVSYHMITI